MKSLSLILLLTLITGSFLNAQAVMNNAGGMIYINKNESSSTELEGKRGGYFGSHPLGEEIQKKYDQFLKLYVKYETTSGAYATEQKVIFKKEIYNSVNKLDRYYKKAIRKNDIPLDSMINDYSHVLDVANQIRFYNTQNFELLVGTAKSEEQIIKYYKSITFEE